MLACNVDASHPVSVVQADVFVEPTRTTMRLTCFAEDLELLQGVEPLEDGRYDSVELLDAVDDHAEFLSQRIVLRDANGERIQATVVEVTPFEIPADGIPAGQLMSYVMEFVLEFKHTQRPDFLTIQQNMVAEGQLLPSELRILLKQSGSDTPYGKMLKPGNPETFALDWQHPPLASDAPPEDWKAWFDTQRQKSLGIESYSSTYSFIYVTNREVRHEVLVPLASLATMIDFQRADEDFLSVEEQHRARQQIEALFESTNPVAIDGKTVLPEFDRVDFYGLDLRDFAMQSAARRVSMASGRVGIIMRYPVTKPPEDVGVTWDVFNSAIQNVQAVVFALDETLTHEFSKYLENNTFKWHADATVAAPKVNAVPAEIDDHFLQPRQWQTSLAGLALLGFSFLLLLTQMLFPAAGLTWARTLLCAGIALATSFAVPSLVPVGIPIPFADPPEFTITEDQASSIFNPLHDNLFRAFDFRTESEIYDGLSQSVAGEQLREFYLDINQSLAMEQQDGAVAKIGLVERVHGELATSKFSGHGKYAADYETDIRPGFNWRCKWNLAGTIEHWGHIHERVNQYDAVFRIEAVDDQSNTGPSDLTWKIVDMRMLDEPMQGVVTTSLRTLPPTVD